MFKRIICVGESTLPLCKWLGVHCVCGGNCVTYIVLFHIVNDNSIVTEQERRERLVRRWHSNKHTAVAYKIRKEERKEGE